MLPFHVYILKCSDGSYYVGHSDNVEARISQHMQGCVKGYTSKRLPVEVVYAQEFPSRGEAIDAERQIKGWTRKKKEALINDDWEKLSLFARKKFNKL